MSNFKFALIAVAVFVLIMTVLTPTNEGGSTEALKDAGYHPIEVGGYAWFTCSDRDVFATKFKAYSPDSTRVVTGAVCQGIFKGKTIRLD